MQMATAADAQLTPSDLALRQLVECFDQLIETISDGGLDHHDDAQRVRFMQTFEEFRRRLSLVDHEVIREGVESGLPGRLTQPSMQRVLTSTLRISRAEASRRVRAAEAVGPRVSMLGEVLAPVRPVLAAAQSTGQVGTEQVQIIVAGLAQVDRPGYDPADITAAEELLTSYAHTFGPEDLRRLSDTVIDRIDPNGTRPRDELNRDRRHLQLRPTSAGAWVGEWRLTGALGAKLNALLSPLAKPRVNTTTGPNGIPVETRDGRTPGQRMHDALEDICDRLLRTGNGPESGGVPATVIVTLDHHDLQTKTGYGTTSDGVLLSTRDVLALAAEAEIIPAVLNRSGAVLSLGRSRRIASRSQTLALIARDNGCSFPGCAHPPEYCERHHITAWIDGGNTDLNNLTLLCRYHHHNFASRGWTGRINPDGIPEWTPPRWIDPTQTPMINTRIQASLAQRRFTKPVDQATTSPCPLPPSHSRMAAGPAEAARDALAVHEVPVDVGQVNVGQVNVGQVNVGQVNGQQVNVQHVDWGEFEARLATVEEWHGAQLQIRSGSVR